MAKSWRLPLVLSVFLATTAFCCLWPGWASAWIPVLAFAFWCLVSRKWMLFGLVVAALLAFGRFWLIERGIAMIRSHDAQETSVEGVVLRHELPTPQKQRLLIVLNQPMNGVQTVTVDLPRFPEHAEREVWQFTCLQQPPTTKDDVSALRGRYARGIKASCVAQGIHVLPEQASCWAHPLLCGRGLIVAGIEQLWPRPIRSLVLGLLLGDKADFPQQVLDQFSRAGISHIIALSGFNITVIIVSLEAIALRLAVAKKYRPYAIMAAIGLFVIFVGSAASIVRAAGMGVLAVWGKSLGRQPSAPRLLLISAAVMTIAMPFTLMYDVGFQLSCCATFGLLAFSEWMEAKLWFIPEIGGIRGSLSTTLAASLPTTPLLMYQFGNLSLIAPVTNILVLPVIPHIMWAGAVAVLLGHIVPPVAVMIASVVSRACQYILDASAWTAGLPFAAVPVELSAFWFVAFSAAILLFSLYVQRRAQDR